MSICGIDRVFADPSGLGFCKRPSSLNMPGLYAAHLLPTANGDIDVKRIKFYEAGDPSSPFSSQNCGSASPKWIEYEPVAPAAIADQVRDQGDGLHGRMHFELATASRMEAVDPGIIEHIGPVPSLTSQAEIVDVCAPRCRS